MRTRTAVPLARPLTGPEELEEVRSVLESGQLSQGPKVEQFERMVAELTGARHAFAASSCTTALHLALVALGIGPGDEVLVPDFTFPATANVVVQQGAVPVLVDVDLDTYNVDPSALAHHLTARTRAIIPVDLFGLAADMDPVMAFAAEHGLAVLEDAACALGASYNGRPCGVLGDVGCLSFHPRKVVTTGEGGMVLTNRDDLAERLRLLRSHGGVRREQRFTFEDAGFNYRLSDVAAALGVAQMRRLPQMTADRRRLASELRAGLAGVRGITVPPEPAWGGHVYQAFVALVAPGVDRDAFIGRLRAMGVEATLGTYALHAQPFFGRAFGYRPGALPRSHDAFLRAVALPLFPQMTEADVEAVLESAGEALAQSRT